MNEFLQRLGLLPSLCIASLSGVCFGLAAPPRPYAWLAWVGFAPLLLVLRRETISLRRAFLLGWVGGLGVGLFGFPWIGELLQRFAGLPAPLAAIGMVGYSAWMAIPYGIWGLAVRWGPHEGWASWVWPLVTFPAITVLWPVVFPYTPVIGFASAPQWIQVAELGGAPLVEWQAMLCGLLLVEAVRRSRSGALTVLCVALAVSVPLASTWIGGQRMSQLDREARSARKVKFGIIQPNTPVTQTEPDLAMQRLRETSRQAQEQGAQIVVWPEAGTYPFMLPRIVREDPSDPRGQVLLLHQVPTLFGAVTMPPDKELTFNTLFHMDEDGQIRDAFDKVILVPFGENIPLIDPELAERLVRNIGQLARGPGAARFLVRPLPAQSADPQAPAPDPVAIGPMICIEDIHTGFARSVAIQEGGVQVFVNATIDAWYGAGQEPWEHLALAQFRSVEHRIPMVRSVSTGVSAVIDHTGRLAAHIPSRDVTRETLAQIPPELIVRDVALPRNTIQAPTFFALIGWQLPRVCQTLMIAGGALWAGLQWIRRRQLQETVPAQGQIA